MLGIKYFAYGSNLDISRLRFRIETSSEPVNRGVVYVLQNYKLAFNVGYFNSFANIVPAIGESVEGVLYDITPYQLKELDRFEALYEKHFFYINANYVGCVYVAQAHNIEERISVKPSLDYLNIILDGCKDYGLIKTYNKLVNYKLKNFKVKKSKHKLIDNDKNFQWWKVDSELKNEFV